MATYKLTPAARADLKSIWNYTDDRWGKSQAKAYLINIEETFLQLANSPSLGIVRNDIRKGYRSFVSGKHVIFYRVSSNETLEIVRILNTSMDVSLHISEETPATENIKN